MFKPLPLILAVGLVLVLSGTTAATIESFNQFVVDLTKTEQAKAKATWSEPDQVVVGPQGLGWGTAADPGTRDFWLQTTEPMALGLSWRPTIAAYLRVTVTGPGNNGQVYARYSADARHWTTWQPLEAEPMPAGGAGKPTAATQSFKGLVRVPYREREKYSKLERAYSRREDVAWSSDEEALVTDILKSDPAFFATATPFVGYVQVLYEAQLPGGHRITGLTVDANWSVGGIHTRPKDPATEKGRDGPWRYRSP